MTTLTQVQQVNGSTSRGLDRLRLPVTVEPNP